jgi:large subunit ribosomal protein L10
MDKAEKQAELEFLNGHFTKAQIAFCSDYRGLTVAQVTKLRKELRKAGAEACVVKNTLGRLSATKTLTPNAKSAAELEKFTKVLKGPSMVVFSNSDPVAPAKVLTDFAKGHDKLKIKGAYFEGAFMDTAGVQALSKMPGRTELLSMLLRVISAPATQIVRLLNAPGTQVTRVIDAHRQNLEKKEAK